MRTFEQLTILERSRAIKSSMCYLVSQIVGGVLDVELIAPRNQAKLKRIMDERWEMEAPRLAMLRIFHDKNICQELNKVAVIHAEESCYDNSGNQVRRENLQ